MCGVKQEEEEEGEQEEEAEQEEDGEENQQEDDDVEEKGRAPRQNYSRSQGLCFQMSYNLGVWR